MLKGYGQAGAMAEARALLGGMEVNARALGTYLRSCNRAGTLSRTGACNPLPSGARDECVRRTS